MEHDMKFPSDFLGRVIFFIQEYYMQFLKGAGTTILIAFVGTLIGCLIGFIVGIVQTIPVSKNENIFKRVTLKFVNILMSIYVEVFRGTPMMVQAVFIFYGAAQYLNFHMDKWFAAFFIVSINTGAYMAETVRGGIISIDPGQTEGAKAIGMNHFQTMLYVIFPQTLRNIMPQIGNNFIINIKDTSVLSVISVVELYFATMTVAGTYFVFFEPFTVTMAIYLVLTVTCSKILRYFERKMDGPDSYDLATTDTLAHTSGMLNHPKKRGVRYGK